MERADTDVHQQNQSISFELQEHDITEIGEEDSSDESMIDIENDLINEIHEIIDDNSEVANSQQKAVGEIKEVEAESEEESSAPKEQLVCTDTRSMDDDFISLKRFREDGTEEEHKERNKRMHGSGILFTREAYQKYTTTEEVDKEYKHDWQAILQLEEWIEQEGIVPRQPKQVEPEPAKVPEASVLPLPVVEAEPAPDNVPHIGTSPLDALMMKEKKGRVTRQQKQRMNDLKIAAMAAGNNGQSPSSSSSERYSRYTKEEHIKFIAINEKKKKGIEISELDDQWFRDVCQGLAVEKDEFMKDQCAKAVESGIYSTSNPKVEQMFQNYYKLELERLKLYPQFYKYFHLLNLVPDPRNEKSLLLFKRSLGSKGQIAPCNPKVFDTPRKMDLFKQYMQTEPQDEGIDYYQKKMPPAISKDSTATTLASETKPDIVISIECLIDLIQLMHSFSFDMLMPITVVKNEKGTNTIFFDHALPQQTATPRDRNKIVYDLAFKSLCLDWEKRHSVQINVDKQNTDTEENLQYNLWSFGELSILIRHQLDGELKSQDKKAFDKKVLINTKLEYLTEDLKEIVTPMERATNWIRSYVGGHATLLEGRIDVIKNILMKVEHKQMLNIMGENWRPAYESDTLLHILSKIYKTLEPGTYVLRRKAGDRNLLIYQSTQENNNPDMNLYTHFKPKPDMGNIESCYVPAWSFGKNEHEQIAWTFPTK